MLPVSAPITWRRLDTPGHESARLSIEAGHPLIEGMAVFAMDGESCALAYQVTCDRAWRTTAADVDGWVGATPVSMRIRREPTGRWIVNGLHTPSLDGCDDVDLSFSPATNTLPIRRLGLEVGEKADVVAAWWNVPGVALAPLEQTYERIGPFTYRYTSTDGAFVALLDVRADGLLTRYQGLWDEDGR
jgi:hypothetical protein